MDEPDIDHDFYNLIKARYCARPYEAKPGVWVRCGSRLRDKCESCAEIYRGDWAAIARSGIFDEDGTVVPGYKYAFLTLTAPSFGKVDETGAARDPENYDYVGQVSWNYASSALWRSTLHRLHRRFPGMAYFGVVEAQRRGVRHYHVILRLPEDEAHPFADQIASVARGATTAHNGSVIEWGTQVDCRYISGTTDPGRSDLAQTVWYVSKALGYALKSIGDAEIGVNSSEPTPLLLHMRSLASAARTQLRCAKCSDTSSSDCSSPAHRNLGASSQVVLYGRGSTRRSPWSFVGLTRTAQRSARTEWVRSEVAAGRRDARDGMSAHERDAARWLRESRSTFAARPRSRETHESRAP